MKIESGVKSVGSPVTTTRTSPATVAQQQPAVGSATHVAITALSARLQEITASMGSEAPLDAARVGEIKQAIAEGRFTVNPERIADGLIRSVRDLLNQQHG